MDTYKYNYIYTGDHSWSEVFFNDIINLDNVKFFYSDYENFNSKLLKFINICHYSRKIRKIIGCPFKNIVYKKLFAYKFKNNNPVCFIFQGNKFKFYNDIDYINELRRRYPNGKIVLYMIDIVSKNPYLNIEYANNTFDFIITYDKADAEKYNWIYIPTPFSKVEVDKSIEQAPTDVYFCGEAKERFNALLDIYDRLEKNGVKCNFYLPNAPINQDEKIRNGIHFRTRISYRENLSRLNMAKCNLELMQEGAVGFTPRLWEAIIYDKHLISNNKAIKESPYYYPEGIHFIDEDLESIIEKINKPIIYPPHIKNLLSPMNFLNIIEHYL